MRRFSNILDSMGVYNKLREMGIKENDTVIAEGIETIFLEKYFSKLSNDGQIIFKTDNADLFNYSLETFEANGFKIIDKTDNYDGNDEFDAITEYEENFRSVNKNINRMVLRK